MGKIKKLQDKGATILPLTVADAVLMNSAEAGNLSTYLEALKSGVDFLLSIIGEDQAGDIFLKTKDGMPRGFYTEGFVSAGGKSTPEGGGGGGANLTQIWESLQGNNDTFKDRLINIAHIPTLTTGKISDFVSATQAIANTAVANKADKNNTLSWLGDVDIDTAGRLSIGYNISGTPFNGAFLNIGTNWGFQLIARRDEGIAYRGYHPSPDLLPSFEEWKRILDENGGELEGALTLQNSQFSGIKNSEGNLILGAGNSAAFIGAVDSNTTIVGTSVHSTVLRTTQDDLWHYRGDKGSNYLILDTANASSHVVDLTSSQTISGAKTFSNLKVSNTDLVTNLNAEMVGGYISSVLFTCESGYGVDVNAPHRNKKSGPLLYKISSNCTNIPPLCTNGVLVHFNRQGTDTAFQLVSDYSNTVLYYRSGNFTDGGSNYLYGRTWRKIAFTDTVLPLTGGTLTGALTVNAPINNTGALKLLGASEVSSTGMAVHSGAKALGSHANALGYYTTTERHYQTVIGCYNEPDTSSLFVIGAGSNEQSRKNVFTVSPSGDVSMGRQLRIGDGGKNDLYLVSDSAEQFYVHTSAGIPFLIQGNFVRRGASSPNTTLGTDQHKWFNVFTESLKIADANLTYDTGTLTVDKALKTTSTLTAPQGEFANHIKIGDATISWNPNGYLELNEGLASHKFISAGGIEKSSTIAELQQRVAQLEAQLISLTNKE